MDNIVRTILDAWLAWALWTAQLLDTSSVPHGLRPAAFIWLMWSPFILLALVCALWAWREDRRFQRQHRL